MTGSWITDRCYKLTRVDVTLLDVLPVPLTDAGTASVGENETANLLEGCHLAVAGNRGTDLLGTGGNSELALGGQTMVMGLTGDRSSTGHVLVRGVGARADKSDLEFLWPVVLLDSILELRKRSSQVRGEGSVDVGLELGQVLS